MHPVVVAHDAVAAESGGRFKGLRGSSRMALDS